MAFAFVQINLLRSRRLPAMKPWLLFIFIGLTGCAAKNMVGSVEKVKSVAPVLIDSTNSPAVRAEQIRRDCINGRRLVCGKVLNVLPDGLVVDSGYTDLLRTPLAQSWVIPGSVSAVRNPTILELNEPGTPCVGLVFLTDIPKRQQVKNFDYVVMMGYPAGQYIYMPVPNVEKPIRKFTCGLDTAVKLNLAAEEKPPAK
jgi:hypothetical protein